MDLLFSNKVSKAFVDKVISISNKLGIDPNWAMFVMNNESGLSSSIENSIGCVGLIQFCPDATGGYKTLGGVAYKLSDIKIMDPVKQLDLVYQYWKDMQKQYGTYSSYHDLYLATFYPYAIDQPDDYVVGSERSQAYAQKVAQQNPSFNVNKDAIITKAEFKKSLDDKAKLTIGTAYYDVFFKKRSFFQRYKKEIFFYLPIAILVVVMIWIFTQKK